MSRSIQNAVYLVRQARATDTMGEKVESLIKAMEQLINRGRRQIGEQIE